MSASRANPSERSHLCHIVSLDSNAVINDNWIYMPMKLDISPAFLHMASRAALCVAVLSPAGYTSASDPENDSLPLSGEFSAPLNSRSEERRVGEECRSVWSTGR